MPAARPLRLVIPRYGEVRGVPARAMVFSNSERMELGCDRRWFHRYAEHLRPEGEARALTYGTGWALVMEDLHRWWMVNDSAYPLARVVGAGESDEAPIGSCPWCDGGESGPEQLTCDQCAGSGLSVVFRLRRDWFQGAAEGEQVDEVAADVSTVFRALTGYCRTYGVNPSSDFRVVAVEHQVAAPVVNPATGKPFRPRIPLVEDASGWRIAGPGEVPTTWASWPWYQIGKLDVVLQHRRSGLLWIEDNKSSRDAQGYLKNVTIDPQTVGYAWMLGEQIRAGGFGADIEAEVVGMQFDITSSSLQQYPKRLVEKELAKKDEKRAQGFTHHPPQFSKATNATTPSWLYAEALRNAAPSPDGQRPDPADYEDHLQWCREFVDPRLYVRECVVASPQAITEYRWEMIGVARRLARQIVAAVKVTSPESLAVAFPRTPLCRRPGGSCPFTSLCAGGDHADARAEFHTSAGLRWERSEPASQLFNQPVAPPTTDLDF